MIIQTGYDGNVMLEALSIEQKADFLRRSMESVPY